VGFFTLGVATSKGFFIDKILQQEAASRYHSLVCFSMASDGHYLFIHTNAGLFKGL
jgi:hypothetical protein